MDQAAAPRGERDPVAVGAIRRPVGLKGEVAASAFGATLAGLRLPCAVMLLDAAGAERDAVLVETRETPGGGVRCRFEGIDSLEKAQNMRELTIAIEASRLPALAENRFYHFELEGMAVVGGKDERIGTVVEVHTYPTTDAIEVRDVSGRSIIVPLNGGAVKTIDKERRSVVVDTEMLEELL